MGTVFSFDVRSPGVDATAMDAAIAWLHWVDRTFSTYRDDSEISRLGRGELALEDCAAEVAAVLSRCEQLQAETGGYFIASWGGRLDPSGYVKGWAIERVSDMLAAAGSVNHCVNGGGDVQCIGRASDEREWNIGIVDPFDRTRTIATVAGTRLAVATSGSAERGAHILDPHTGTSPNAFASVTVVGTHLARVDALATAAFAMGADAVEWLRAKRLTSLLVATDGSVTRLP
jgi:thiamine biosynthesis lipoprotein